MDKDKPINKVCFDTCEIFTRLYDHRPFLNGEIQNFLREFEEKRGNRDIESLLKSREKLTDLQDSLNAFDGESIKASLESFSETVQKTTTALEVTVNRSETNRHLNIEAKEEERRKRWQDFLENNTTRLQSVDNYLKDQELELRKHYEQLEEKLKQGH